nr:CocE/NonD family hydrolase [Clostridium muellerianum]
MPLPCEIIFERDVPVKLRDKVTIYTDIFRPADKDNVPAIVAWSPYGKNGSGNQNLDTFPGMLGIDQKKLSGLMKFEGPDPGYWCNEGYAVCNPDARGAFMSEGNIYFWGSQDGRDGYDYIEWLAEQEWCNGKIGLSGNSWLAVSQWFIAAEQPPHLAAIAPWEGHSDLYGDDVCRGGIPNQHFNEDILTHLYGNNYTEDIKEMLKKYPLMNSYWEDKIPKFENIHVPAYIVASYTNSAHTNGTFRAFRNIKSENKWLRVHNSMEWIDYYEEKNKEELRKFFDYYLKGIENDWIKTQRVRLSVLDLGGEDIVNRVENEFPLARTNYKKLYLDAKTKTLNNNPISEKGLVSYNTDNGKGEAAFTIAFHEETEITGYSNVKLWVEANASNDMDLFVFIQKLDKNDNVLVHRLIKPKKVPQMNISQDIEMKGPVYFGPNGRLRVSLRNIDEKKSKEEEPYLTYDKKELLKEGEIVSVEIPLWPTALIFHKDEKLRLVISAYNIIGAPLPNIKDVEPNNKGNHIIHTGGKYESYLQIPNISEDAKNK